MIPIKAPAVGDIVHYQSLGSADGKYPSEMRAAIITKVTNMDNVSLSIFNPEGIYFNQNVSYDTNHVPGTWHWPAV